MIHNKILFSSFLITVLFLFSGCYSAFHAFNTGGKTPVYLNENKGDDFSYYVNGEKIDPIYTIYSVKNVSEQTNMLTGVTTRTTVNNSLPALRLKANKPYVVLKIVNNKTKFEKELVIKSNLAEGAKIIMYFQGMMTLGIGNAIDLSAKSVYAWPMVNPNQ